MIFFPRAKINIGLYVTKRRTDGYHDIETVFFPIGLTDILEVIPNAAVEPGQIVLHLSGIPVDGKPEANLVTHAYNLIRRIYPIPSVNVYLHKQIPTGAGLGGGSSDGSTMLKALDQIFSLGITDTQMRELALQLGSDCPFFLHPEPALAGGRGEVLKQIHLDISGLILYIFQPIARISTQKAYQQVTLGKPEIPWNQLVTFPVETWKGQIKNAFEPYAATEIPEIGKIITCLNKNGAIYSSLTGSGSAIYGFFKNDFQIPAEIADYLIWKELLS